ncbi:MAG TPA: twin-arginine translocase TatA/TatE family subunit [Candidatus Limnocylindrales bacterium]|nr:twin-arginine translocase TatA/TatE family subunit [Candidatus Limnocylindrales bacterium]
MVGGRIGIGEILLVLAVALIIFGPAKLPEISRSIGNALREFRKATKDLGQSVGLDDNKEAEHRK